MKPTQRRRPTWKCRVAERLRVVTELGQGGGLAVDREGALVRWARRHVDGCERCLAERSEWQRITQAMRAIERPVAPEQIFHGVMAKIAREREAQEVQNLKPVQRLMFPWSSEGLEVAMAIATTMIGIITTWSFLMMSVPEGLGRLYGVFAATFAVWKNAVTEVTSYGMADMIFGGFGLHYTALIWTLAGLGITAGILMFQER